jgi:Holliday junction resolvasome RuvABC endonuclease subunit
MTRERYFFLGVDPGKTGAVALIDNQGAPLWVDDIPCLGGVVDAKALVDMLSEREEPILCAAIERTQAMPQTPRSVCHSLGMSEGMALAALLMQGLRVIRPRPAEWKRAMRVPADKAKAKEMAEMMFPSMKHRLQRVSDHNRAEALLLADYARRTWEKAA